MKPQADSSWLRSVAACCEETTVSGLEEATIVSLAVSRVAACRLLSGESMSEY